MIVHLCPENLWKGAELMKVLYADPEVPGDFHEEYWTHRWTDLLKSKNAILLGYEYEKVIVSILGAMAFRDLDTGELRASVISAFTLPQLRGNKFSSRLLDYYVSWARGVGCKVAYTNYIEGRPHFDSVVGVFRQKGFYPHERAFKKEL